MATFVHLRRVVTAAAVCIVAELGVLLERGALVHHPQPQQPGDSEPSSAAGVFARRDEYNGDGSNSDVSKTPRYNGYPKSEADLFRVCRKEQLIFPTHESDGTDSFLLPINYQCEGGAYDNFTDGMFKYALTRRQNSAEGADHRERAWGARRHPLRDGTNILVVGNSHTRQCLHALICQHAEQVTGVRRLGPFSPRNETRYGTFDSFHFSNNASVTLITNSPLVFAKNWTKIFEKHGLLTSIQSYDAVVLGNINGISLKNRMGMRVSNYSKQMYEYIDEHPDMFDPDHWSPFGIDIHAMAGAFAGPIIVLPMFSAGSAQQPREAAAAAAASGWRRSGARGNVRFLRSVREHVAALGECASGKRLGVDACHVENTRGMHQCTGSKGGHPDLQAWDLIEALHG